MSTERSAATPRVARGALRALTAAACVASSLASAAYPEKPIRVVVPFQPGGNIDITTRTIAPSLSKLLGQPIVVDNRAGASGLIASEYVARSAPDGYTLLVGSTGTLTLAPAMYPQTRYKPVVDFAAIGLICDTPTVLIVHPSLPAENVKQLIALARAQPGKLTFARAGIGLAGDLFRMRTGIHVITVAYKGGSPALTELIGGQVDALFDQLPSAAPHIRAGRVRALAVTTSKRARLFPDIPTLEESGVTGANASTYAAMLGPAGMPSAMVVALNGALKRSLSQTETKERLADLGADVWSSTPEDLATLLRDDYEKWQKVVKTANLKPE